MRRLLGVRICRLAQTTVFPFPVRSWVEMSRFEMSADYEMSDETSNV